jgi:hypothetical protein
MAHIVGVVCSASTVAPWGTFFSFNLQNALYAASRNALSSTRTWWTRARIYLSPISLVTIHQLMKTLIVPEGDPLWTRPISLYFDRDLTHEILNDASYAGIGGWSPCFAYKWRIMREDLLRAGFQLKPIRADTEEPIDPLAKGLLINPLEFLAGILNIWVALKIILTTGARSGGYIVGEKSDNTTALSWMSVASRTPDPLLQGLARFGSALLVAAARLLTKIVPLHIQGILNNEADALSRRDKKTQKIPSLEAVTHAWPRLQTCRTCLVPFELLQLIASVTSSKQTEVTYEEKMTQAMTLECVFSTDIRKGITLDHLRRLSTNDIIWVLGTYIGDIKSGDNILGMFIQGDLIRNYVVAARCLFEQYQHRTIVITDPHSHSPIPRLHPYLHELIHQRTVWRKPKLLKEPYATEMFDWLYEAIQKVTHRSAFIQVQWLVYDTQRLGVFSGSRISE